MRFAELSDDLRGMVFAPVVYHDDLVRDAVETEFHMEMLDRRGDASLFIPRGDHDRQQLKFGCDSGWRRALHAPHCSSQP